jgi:hypothetical protein
LREFQKPADYALQVLVHSWTHKFLCVALYTTQPGQFRYLGMQGQSRHVRVNPRRQIRVTVPEQLLRAALIHARQDAHRLEGLSEAMEMQHPPERVLVQHLSPQEITAQRLIGGEHGKHPLIVTAD